MSDSSKRPASERSAAEKSFKELAEKAAGERQQRKIVLPSSGLAHEVLELLEQAVLAPPEAVERSEAWVTFEVGETSFALPVEKVREVVRIEHITRVPHVGEALAGLTTVWGQPVPVLDLRRRIGIGATALGSDSRLLVTSGSRTVGLLVDRVEQVLRVLPSQVGPTPEDLPGTAGSMARGSYDPGKRRSVLLDLESVLRFRRATSEKGISAAGSAEVS